MRLYDQSGKEGLLETRRGLYHLDVDLVSRARDSPTDGSVLDESRVPLSVFAFDFLLRRFSSLRTPFKDVSGRPPFLLFSFFVILGF